MFGRKWKIILWVGTTVVALFLAGILYSLFFKPTGVYSAGGGNGNTILLVILGLIIGILLMMVLSRASKAARTTHTITESSHTIVESMRKVFKIVCAEGYFSEVYDYKDSKKYFSFIPAYKRALVIVKAKALIGFDFEKFIWETDETTQQVKLVSFPEPELLSIDTNYNYYSIEDEVLYKFTSEDFKRIQENAKKQIEQAAMQSDLPRIAAEQMRMMLTEVIESKKWKLDNSQKLPSGQKPKLPANEMLER